MENGLLFFYFFWIFWIIITFFMAKTKKRTVFAVFTLLCLAFGNIYIKFIIPVSITYLILSSGLIVMQAKLSGMIYHFFCTFTISIGYAAMLSWEANTTIWLFTSREILIPFTIVCLSIFLTNGFYNRLFCGLFGLCIGEFLFKTFLYSISFRETIGDMTFLDVIAVTIMFNIIVSFYTSVNRKIYSSITQVVYK
ncbi:MAG TPA: hypothetical protein VK142_03535 [Bacillota bacterium]|nr:hypothetical protein [Bacillota bacterium]